MKNNPNPISNKPANPYIENNETGPFPPVIDIGNSKNLAVPCKANV